MNFFYLLIFTSFSLFFLQSDLHSQQLLNSDLTEITVDSLEREFEREKQEARELAARFNIPLRQVTDEGRIIELMRFQNGRPVYYATHNAGGADLIGTSELYSGGDAGLDLSGDGQTLGIWDGGAVRITHQEFEGRAEQKDGATSVIDHATHVAGTMLAGGVDSNARGMAFEANLHAYDWDNDNAEMLQAAENGLRISQHSYGAIAGWLFGDFSGDDGWHWFGDPDISETEDYHFGFYESSAQTWDQIAHSEPHYLIFRSAGNDRGLGPSPGADHHYFHPDSGWVYSNTTRDLDGGSDGYNSISYTALAKNIVTVGAVNSSEEMASFSGWGPTDDGRIKPDVVAKGVSVFSSSASSDSAYSTMDGTSMSGPMVSGSSGVLYEHYNDLHPGELMLSSTLKGLIIHTADDMISGNPGPDYRYGWGLMNTEKAAEVITKNAAANGALIYESDLMSGAQYSLDFEATGSEPLKATIVWTDVPGPLPPVSLNPTDLILVNDLDMRLFDSDSTFFYPYILDQDNPADSATTGDNFRDNVEVVFIENPDSNEAFTLTIDHKGSLSGGKQSFSLIVTGANITGLDDYDISADEIVYPTSNICGLSFVPEVVIKNHGSQIIETAYIHFVLNDDDPDSIEWTGSLAPLQNITVELPSLLANSGENTVQIFTAYPNGEQDQNPSNDTIETTFFVNDTILFVDHSAGGNDNGLSWDDAFTNLQDALGIACGCQEVVQIWVAQGHYFPDIGQNQTSEDRNASFQLCSDVQIYGGFDGTETDLTERNWSQNVTFLNGDINGSNDLTDNSYTIVNGSGADTTAVLDGFTVQAGFANAGGGSPNPNFRGAGIYVNNGSPRVENCLIRWNAAGFGGGVYLINSQPQFYNTTIDDNYSLTAGGGLYALNSNFIFKDGTFSWNFSEIAGGGMLNENSNPHIYHTDFWSNEADLGGAMFNSSSSPTISRCSFRGNEAAEKGGGIFNSDFSNGLIFNSQLTGNFAENGGAFYNEDNSSPQIVNSTISGNYATLNGGAIFNEDHSSPEVKNSIIWNNSANGNTTSTSASVYNSNQSFPEFFHSIIQNSNGSGPDWDDELGIDEGGLMDVDPLFVDGTPASNAPDTSGNYMLMECSEAIDAGNNIFIVLSDSLDLDGSPRFVNATDSDSAIVDMGAFEFQGLSPQLEISCMNYEVFLNSDNMAYVIVDSLFEMTEGCDNWELISNQMDTLFMDCQAIGDTLIHIALSNFSGTQMDECSSLVTISDSIAPVAVCQDITVDLDSSGMATISASDIDNGSSDNCDSLMLSVDQTQFDCGDIGTNIVVLTVEDGSENSSTCTAEVKVEDNISPEISCAASVSQEVQNPGDSSVFVNIPLASATDNCGLDSIANDYNSGGADASDDFDLGTTPVIYTATDTNGNSAICTTEVTVFADSSVVAVCDDISISLNSSGMANIDADSLDGGSFGGVGELTFTVNGSSTLSFDCSDIGSEFFTLLVEDESDGIDSCESEITIVDDLPPTAVCQDITVQLDSDGMATISAMNVDNGSSDNCDSLILSVNQTQFDCGDIGTNIIVLTASDGSGNSSTCTAEVEVEDVTAPVAACQDITVDLNSSGMATISGNDINNGSSDNCDSLMLSVDQSQFDCGDIGSNTVVLTASDGSGNGSTCTANVEVEDVTAPVAECQDITVDLNSSGIATISASDIDNGSSDNCDSLMLSVNQTQFDCGDIGTNTVVLTASDVSGNSSTCTANVEVEDVTVPVAECQDITVDLNSSGIATISASDINNGSSDNCDSLLLSVDQTQFDCGDIGSNTVVLTASDGSGNGSTCTANVEVEDVTVPVAECQDITVDLNSSGIATISASDIDNGSSDNCDSLMLSVDQSQFDCGEIGSNTVVLTASDVSGNSSTCTANVEVEDVTAPVAECQDITVDLNSSGIATISASDIDNGSSDNCDSLMLSVDQSQFDCGDIGENTVVLTASDVSGNSSTCTADVEVEDNIPPDLSCATSVSQQVMNPGDSSVFVNVPLASATDNCGLNSIENNYNSGGADASDDFDLGTTTLIYTATDTNGNSSTCTTEVTVFADSSVVATCNDISISLNASGMANVDAESLDGGSFGGVGELTFTVNGSSALTFDCSDIGSDLFTLLVEDEADGADSCEAEITVMDDLPPTAVCQDITVQLDSDGIATISASDIDNGSSDNCDSLLLSVDQTQFDCGDIGSNTVVLTASDVSGNSSTCTANVEVEDVTAPVAECQDITVDLNSSGIATISANDINNGSSDNCDSLMLSLDQTQFDCGDIGSNTVILTASDGSGNSSTCTADVEVEDNIPPDISCASSVSQQVQNPGDSSVFVDIPLASATDNCEFDPIENDYNSGGADASDVFDLGTTTVIYSATDASGNSANCTTEVTVFADMSVVAVCNDISISLDPAGMANVDAELLDGGSFGGVGELTFTVDGSSTLTFDCSDIGSDLFTLLVEDESDGVDSCEAEIMVVDDLPPSAACQDITVQLDSDGMATISASDIDDGSSDNCGIETLVLSDSVFNCGNVGQQTLFLTVTDENDNSSSCTAEVTVEDNEPPEVECNDYTIALGENGEAEINTSDVLQSASDNCGIADITISQTQFNCGDVGINTVILTVTDENGNDATCIAEVTVEDNLPPTIECPSDESIEIPEGETEWFVDLAVASTADNCGIDSVANSHNAGGSNASGTYPLGETVVVFTAWDLSGNQAGCSTLVEISEADSIPPHHLISGHVQTIFGVNINNVQMVVTGDENFTDSTNSDGLYFVEVGSGNTVTMTPEKDENWLDGVSTLDLVLAQQHILNISTFDSPFLHIAADVNDDGITSTFDLVLLQQLILNITNSIAGNTSWRFIPNSYDFTDPSNPLAESFPEMVQYQNLSSDKPDEDWTAVKVGDVSGNAGQSGLRQVHGDYGLRLQPVSGKNGQELIEVRADQHEWLNGFQMEFHFNPDKAKLSGIIIDESVLENFHESNFAVDHRKGHIRVIWFHGHGQDIPPGSELFTLEFKYISEHSLTNYPVLKQRGKLWHSEVYTDMGDKILNIVPVWEDHRDEQFFFLHQNKPNPFSDYTVIPFTSSESGKGSLEVFDLEGKTVFQREIDVVKGENNYTLEYGNLPVGLLYYRLSIGSWSDTMEMLIVR
jgi:hypothetical protein